MFCISRNFKTNYLCLQNRWQQLCLNLPDLFIDTYMFLYDSEKYGSNVSNGRIFNRVNEPTILSKYLLNASKIMSVTCKSFKQ